MKFAIMTLGCKVNQYESQRLREALLSCGHEEIAFSSPDADVYVINTCTVTHRADADNRKLVRKALSRGGRVVVSGCQAVVFPDEIKRISETIEVVPPEDLGVAFGVDLPDTIHGFAGHSRGFVKVQQGCNNFCSYCIVPYARGCPVSRPRDEIFKEVSALHESGFNEVVLTGINIGLYEGGLACLIRGILSETDIPLIRISSVEPWTVDDDLVGLVVSEDRVCSHLHISLQSGSDRILDAMGRPYTSGYYHTLVEHIRAQDPAVCIGTDVMVGFPGETDSLFEEERSFIEGLDLAYMHVFPYSVRPGTPAAVMDGQVAPDKKKERAGILRELSARKRHAFMESQSGTVQKLLVMNSGQGGCSGVTSNYLNVTARGDIPKGDLVDVRIEERCGTVMKGICIG